MALFSYHPSVLEMFPTIRGGAIHAEGVANSQSSGEVQEIFTVEQHRTLDLIGDTPLAELPSLAAWRRVFSGFGVSPTQYRNAAEALLRRLTKRGDIPSINLLVDLANLISIRHRLPVAVFDQNPVSGGTIVRFADGLERFTDLGSRQEGAPNPGEVIFVDDVGRVSARRWCWRQSLQSAAGPDTTDVLITIEGHHEMAEDSVAAATSDFVGLLEQFSAPQSLTAAQLSPASPKFESPSN